MSQTTPPAPADKNAQAGAGGADPSMEDILASIRRILSDDEQPAATQAPPKPAPAPPPVVAATTAELPDEEADALPLSEAMLVSAAPEPAPEPPMPAAPPANRLVAPEAEAAAASSVSSLLHTLVQQRDSLPVYRGGPTIEDLVRDEIRPLLKAWLDAHLPPLVERLVRTEIERVVGRVQG
jgi:cell pole-organizing protein PopZ